MGDIGEARQKVVADWLFLSAAMRGCADSINKYIALVAQQPTHPDTVKYLLQLPALPATEAQSLELFTNAGELESFRATMTKRSASEEAEHPEEGVKRKKKQKKEKDPNAPKRPPSAYIFYQNEIRPAMKEQHPDVTYRELVSMMAAKWQELSGEQKEPYQKLANEAMKKWRVDDANYRGGDATMHSPTLASGEYDDSNVFKDENGDITTSGVIEEDTSAQF